MTDCNSEKVKTTDVIYLHFCKAFDAISHDLKVEGAAQTMCDKQPPFLSLVVTEREWIEKLGMKLSPARREGWRDGVYLRFCFITITYL